MIIDIIYGRQQINDTERYDHVELIIYPFVRNCHISNLNDIRHCTFGNRTYVYADYFAHAVCEISQHRTRPAAAIQYPANFDDMSYYSDNVLASRKVVCI